MVFKLSSQENLLSKIATGNGHGEDSPYFDGWKAYDSDPFHPEQNPHGVIQMGLAENQLCFDLIEDWLLDNQKASICTNEGVNEFKDIANFQDYHGLPEFRNAVAKFMAKVRGNRVTFNPDNIVMSGGATGAHETLAFCLADPGDAFLVPTPYYPGFDRDLRWRTGIQLLPVVCESSNNFKITREAMEAAYERAQEANIKVKGLLINNPSNPLGTVLDRETLRSIASFINEKNIHLVCDEIYAATVFNQPNFISVSEIIEEDIDVQCNTDLVHIVYSLSKDMGFPGFRVGIIYSYNDAVVSCARKMSSFGLVSTQTQYLIAAMLSDDEFVGRFVAESRKRLAKRHRVFTWGLSRAGIKYLKRSNAGLFLWMDLRQLLKDKTFEAEMVLWRVIIEEVKLNVSPGSSFHCSEPGWFRVCFANMDDETMQVALSRIEEFMLLRNVGSMVPVKRMLRQQSLNIGGLSRRFDERIMSPCLRSPHSPMPPSPLIRATN
ncbi:1-aminocyclopropane-1-carboxylate synthase [Tripterygium wilfordii]|uniref:1-aminocyclopropane-1-carboxylate synthase n=1 Tax=Tripterygium wilfordii TaxID=458696 RepID=A0A7J7C7C1_TRIWF|nr:1-aminocyclopropane-1-carboxylate synthase-like [Tripterygium wilfordii]KAF5730033.1 1-aminocyclopropane-1-carboxylate synthase [Tripterygium wilfordii]